MNTNALGRDPNFWHKDPYDLEWTTATTTTTNTYADSPVVHANPDPYYVDIEKMLSDAIMWVDGVDPTPLTSEKVHDLTKELNDALDSL